MARDPVEHVLALALGELSPSAPDKARHRAALGLGPAVAAGASTGVVAKGSAHGWRALRSAGGAGWTAGALLIGAGMGLGFWLRAPLMIDTEEEMS